MTEAISTMLSAQDEHLVERVVRTTNEHPAASLMISYFFKGGCTELGAEFVHKSFREYLFAEAIVEILKRWSRSCSEELLERPVGLYWKDFDSTDSQFSLCRQLCPVLASQWISQEVAQYLNTLLEWEIGRAFGHGAGPGPVRVGRPTEALDPAGWERIRDALADLWDWWGEGVHLRMQPLKRGKKLQGWEKPYVSELLEECMPMALRDRIPAPPRTTTIDAHLGDGLFRLAAAVHHFLIGASSPKANRWDLKRSQRLQDNTRRCQSRWTLDGRTLVRFKPSSTDSSYLCSYIARINAAGWHPARLFPSGVTIGCADLEEVFLPLAPLAECDLTGATLRRANLLEAHLWKAKLCWADLSHAFMLRATLRDADLASSSVAHAHLEGVEARGTIIKDVDLRLADDTSEMLLDTANGGRLASAAAQGRGEKLPLDARKTPRRGLGKKSRGGPSS